MPEFKCLLMLLLTKASLVLRATATTLETRAGCDLFSGANLNCGTTNFEGLNSSYAPSQILYEIIAQSTLPNDTFYPNDTNVACIFAETEFVLELGTGDNLPVQFNLFPDASGTVCAFPRNVANGGLSLGEIKDLGRVLTKACSKCGIVQVSEFTKNDSDVGELQFNWDENPTCLPEEKCIDPSKLKAANATSAATSNETSWAIRTAQAPGTILGLGMACSAALWLLLVSFGAMVVL